MIGWVMGVPEDPGYMYMAVHSLSPVMLFPICIRAVLGPGFWRAGSFLPCVLGSQRLLGPGTEKTSHLHPDCAPQ